LDSNFEKAWEKIKAANRIVILPHKDADGDAIGSAFGLKAALKSIGKKACVWREEEEPHKFMGVIRGLCKCDETTPSGFACHPSGGGEFDLAISVDSADLVRLGKRAQVFQSMGDKTIAIDHHQTFTHFANVNILEEPCGACAETVFKFIKSCGIAITPDIAHNLYLGISSDTGGFRQNNTTPQSMEIGAELMKRGADYGEINTAIFMSNTLKHTRIVGEVLSNLQTFHNDEIIVLNATRASLDKFEASDDDAKSLVNFAINIVGVKIAFFLKEKDGIIKVSARSNYDEYNVAELCKIFGGGGHMRAAGCEIGHVDMERAIGEVAEAASRFIDEVDKIISN